MSEQHTGSSELSGMTYQEILAMGLNLIKVTERLRKAFPNEVKEPKDAKRFLQEFELDSQENPGMTLEEYIKLRIADKERMQGVVGRQLEPRNTDRFAPDKQKGEVSYGDKPIDTATIFDRVAKKRT